MFKINGKSPSIEDDVEEIADYIELKAVLSENKKISVRKVVQDFLKSTDDLETSGINPSEEKINSITESITAEFVKRNNSTQNKYPFNLAYGGNVLEFIGFTKSEYTVYIYLLLATRLNMKDNKRFRNIDGTKLFEHLSAIVLANYFGERSQCIVFGTSEAGTFPDKVNDLCIKTGEGGSYFNHFNSVIDEQDDKLDVIVWTDFSDKRKSKFWAFGQCKTGTHWENERFQLQPQNFCKKWFYMPPTLDPLRMFFIADVLEKDKWAKRVIDAGLFFDRLRIVDCFPKECHLIFNDSEKTLLDHIHLWTKAALNFTKKVLN